MLTFALDTDLLECFCSGMCVDGILITLILSIFLFVAVVITALVLGVQVLLQPRLALWLSSLPIFAKQLVITSRWLASCYSKSAL